MWSELLKDLILGLVGLVISALGVYVTYLINSKIKNAQVKEYVAQLNDLVQKAVLETYQTYVEELKENDMFDSRAQKKALKKALTIVETNLPTDLEQWLKTQFPAFESYLTTLIEAQIGLLKRGN